MAKLPDISEITKKIEKIDIQGLFDNVKTAFNNATGSPSHPPLQSELIAKCQILQEVMQSTLKSQAEVNDQINQLKHKIGELSRAIEAYEVAKQAPLTTATTKTTSTFRQSTVAPKTKTTGQKDWSAKK